VIGAIAVHPFIVAAGVILFVAALVFGGHSVREEPPPLALAPLARRLARRAGDPVARRIASLAGPVSVLALVLMLGMIALLIQIARTVS